MSVDKTKMSTGQKAAHTRKWRRASELAHRSGQNATTFAKYFLAKKGYKCISLDSKKGYEYKGVVDLIAIKRNKIDPDILIVLLLQVKGGTARVTEQEIVRLRQAVRRIKVGWNVAHKPQSSIRFSKRVR